MTVESDGTGRVKLPETVPAGEHEVVVVLEPVSLDETLIEAGQDTQDTPEIGQLDHVLCRFAALLEVPGQAAVAVGERAERGLDPPPDRQGREAAGGGVAA